jgi:sugar O-acyltransferase (sialic acid O-acetyltransferase NeuD family)
MTELVGVFGAGGCGRGILPLLRTKLGKDARLVFVEDLPATAMMNGQQVLGWRDFLADGSASKSMCLAIADPMLRARIYDRCVQAGVSIIGAAAANICVMDDVKIGEGACLSPFVTLTSNISIGKCFHANLYSYVEHDCLIGNFVTFGPGAKCNGNVVIEDFVYVGSSAVIKQGKPGSPLIIGKGAVVGMGAVVTRSVAAGAVVAGNPAHVMEPKS